jgi:tRNA (guanine37-N1)-methyltransferase
MGKAVESGIFDIRIIDIRDYSEDRFRRCDDYPYGGVQVWLLCRSLYSGL